MAFGVVKVIQMFEASLNCVIVCCDDERTDADVINAVFQGVFLVANGADMKISDTHNNKLFTAWAAAGTDVVRVITEIRAYRVKAGTRWTRRDNFQAILKILGTIGFRVSDLGHVEKSFSESPEYHATCDGVCQIGMITFGGAALVDGGGRIYYNKEKIRRVYTRWRAIRRQKAQSVASRVAATARRSPAIRPTSGAPMTPLPSTRAPIPATLPSGASALAAAAPAAPSFGATLPAAPTALTAGREAESKMAMDVDAEMEERQKAIDAELLDTLGYRGRIAALTTIPDVLNLDVSKCFLSGRSVRFPVIPNIPEAQRVGALARVVYDRVSLETYITSNRDRALPYDPPRGWPTELSPLPLNERSFKIDGSRQADIDDKIVAAIEEIFQMAIAERAITIVPAASS